jgi:hypothetical protein
MNEEDRMKADILSTVAAFSEKYNVDLSSKDFQDKAIGAKMLGAGFESVLGKYTTADQQAKVLDVGLDWVGKVHGIPKGETGRYAVATSILGGLLGSGAVKDEDVVKSWGFTKPATTLLNYFASNPGISITSGLHELEDKFGKPH